MLRGISGRPLPTEAWEIVAALLIIAGRAWRYPLSGLYRDWVVLLGLFWIFTAAAGRTKVAPWVTAAFMTGLLVLYGSGQLPFLLHPGAAR